jgi:hypothetical protein
LQMEQAIIEMDMESSQDVRAAHWTIVLATTSVSSQSGLAL